MVSGSGRRSDLPSVEGIIADASSAARNVSSDDAAKFYKSKGRSGLHAWKDSRIALQYPTSGATAVRFGFEV
jgi:hypothetical protein